MASGIAPHLAKQLIRPGDTRWNTVIESMKRAIMLSNYIQTCNVEVSDNDWRSMEKVVILLDPICVACDRLQSVDTQL